MELKNRVEQLPPDLDRVARASLAQLGDIRIDDVLAFIDRGLENMPSYMDLYRRWETQQWAVSDLDFTADREHWLQAGEFEREVTLWGRRLFFNAEIELFLSTQMVDEARHTVFFDRWWREVVGTDAPDMETLLRLVRPDVNEGYDTLFYDRLPSTAQRLASNPKDIDAFIEGVTIYHIVVEATLALTGQRFELESMRELELTHHGFYQGFTAVARDESRHVNFGVKVLQEAVREDPERFAPLIQRTLVECLPLISGTIEPPDPRYYSEYGRSEEELMEFAMNSLNKRLRAIGINLAA